jgi:hypothetical protein
MCVQRLRTQAGEVYEHDIVLIHLHPNTLSIIRALHK